MITATAMYLDFGSKGRKGKVDIHLTFPASEKRRTAPLYILDASEPVYMFVKHGGKPEQVYIGIVRVPRSYRTDTDEQVADMIGEKKEVLVTELAAIPDEETFEVIIFTEQELAHEASKRIEGLQYAAV